MSKAEKPEKPAELQRREKVVKGVMSIPKGELEDMEREYKRVARKRRPVKTETPE